MVGELTGLRDDRRFGPCDGGAGVVPIRELKKLIVFLARPTRPT